MLCLSGLSTQKKVIIIIISLFMTILVACQQEQKTKTEEPLQLSKKKLLKQRREVIKDVKSKLFKAVEQGDKEIITKLMGQINDIDVKDKNGYTLLHWAVLMKQEEMASFLIARGGNVNNTLPSGFTPLHDAVYAGSKSMVQLLVANGARIYAKDKQGKRPLDLAVEQKHHEMLRLLNPLHIAVQAGKLAKVKELLEQNPDSLSIKDERGWQPLHIAIKKDHLKIFNFLVDQGADINARGAYGATPLRIALENHREKIANLLRERGAVDESDELFLKKELKEKEAIIWHIFHTGWAIKTRNYFLIFDYVPLEHFTLPKKIPACLSSGEINPNQLKDLQVVVFVPMVHNNNHVKTIFKWQKYIKNITYIFGGNKKVTGPNTISIKPWTRRKYNDLEMITIGTTGFGVGFVVKADGIVIFHGGDHESSHQSWNKFRKGIDFLYGYKKRLKKFHIVFLQMIFQEQIDSDRGVIYALETLQPQIMFPTTAMARTPNYKDFLYKASRKKIQSELKCAENRGDLFFYKDGKIE